MNAEEKQMSPVDAARRMKEIIERIRTDAILMDESDVIQVFRNEANRLRLELDEAKAEEAKLRGALCEALRNETRQRVALLRIWVYPVQPDPIACAHAMQDMQGIAGEAMGLKP